MTSAMEQWVFKNSRFQLWFSLCTIITTGVACSGSDNSSGSPFKIDSLEEIPDAMASGNVPGMGIATIRNFQIDEVLFYGTQNQITGEPVTANTVFRGASFSKSIAAITAMAVSQDGLIALDEDINSYLSSWQVKENSHTTAEKVTLRRLLSHTAGISVQDYLGYPRDSQHPTLVQILDGVSPANTIPVFVKQTPGSGYDYSNSGYSIIQQTLIDVTVSPFEQLASERVFLPLSMMSSTFEQTIAGDIVSTVSAGHDSQGNVVDSGSRVYPALAAAGLRTTPSDMARFLIEMQLSINGNSNIIMPQSSINTMVTSASDNDYGLGFRLWDKGGEPYFGHGGALNGFRLLMMAHKSQGMGIVIMTNSEHGVELAEEVSKWFATQYEWPGYQDWAEW